ncbi:MAG: transglycosylase domain-containing protein [Bifidobacteriaceae bacterium]|jgi:membrane peptidoglycan carboxypeptidase|nr:transglycosylase domain-containing protein [Bifidobacteriaceae bacterium]
MNDDEFFEGLENETPHTVKDKGLWSLKSAVVLGVLALSVMFSPVFAAVVMLDNSVNQSTADIGAVDVAPDSISQKSTLYANDGKTVIASFYSLNRIAVKLDQISVNLQNAVIAREDKRFYQHAGIDFVAMIRAALATLSNSTVQGGSTLTQQYVKNLLIDKAIQNDDEKLEKAASEQSLMRKLREASMARDIERNFSKQQILEGYLNIAPFGANLYGAEVAAQRYFSKSAVDLTIVEAATIAGVTKSPVMFDPLLYPDTAEVERNKTLDSMYTAGFITKTELDEALALPLKKTLHTKEVKLGCQAAGKAAFFCDYIRSTIQNDTKYGETLVERQRLLNNGGLQIYSTLDAKAQEAAEKAVYENVPPEDSSGIAAALASVEPSTGKIVAMSENRYYGVSNNPDKWETTVNYGADLSYGGSSGFSIGSTFKPFIISEWLSAGHTLNETIPGKRTFTGNDFACSNGDQAPWRPTNANGGVLYEQTVLRALQQSTNIPFLTMATKLGLCNIYNTAYAMGFRGSTADTYDIRTSDAWKNPSSLIGINNSSPLNMASAYATIANHGIYCKPQALVKVVDRYGNTISEYEKECSRGIDENIADTMAWALETYLTDPGALGYGSTLEDDRPAGAKTGTADSVNHLWTIGFTPELSAAVWMGYPTQDVPLRGVYIKGTYYGEVYSGTIPMTIWREFMNDSLRGKSITAFPEADQTLVGNGTSTLKWDKTDWEQTPTPTPAPKPKATPTPKPSEIPDPEPVETETPQPEPTETPAPEPTVVPEPSSTVTPEPEPSSTTVPEAEVAHNKTVKGP